MPASTQAAPGQEDPIVRQAVEWILSLSADDPTQRDAAHSGFTAWKAADPRHAAAASRLEHLLGGLEQLRQEGGAAPARKALGATWTRATKKRQRVRQISAALLLGLALPLAWMVTQERSPAYWMSDVRSGEGDWSTSTLTDGSTLQLGSLSAVKLSFSAESRKVELVQGNILVDVARDADRPFIVQTTHGTIRALGTRFKVHHTPEETTVTMLESRVEVRPAGSIGGATAYTLSAGQQLRMNAQGLSQPEDVDAPGLEYAWQRHQLVARNLPLSDVLRELDRQRPGRIVFDADALARVRVSAVLPLDDTDRALQLLVNSLPDLRVRLLTSYLVRIDLQVPNTAQK